MLNTIIGGLAGGREIISTQMRYAIHVLTLEYLSTNLKERGTMLPEVEIVFLEKDTSNIHSYNDDLMVITMMCNEMEIEDSWKIKKVLQISSTGMNLRSSASI